MKQFNSSNSRYWVNRLRLLYTQSGCLCTATLSQSIELINRYLPNQQLNHPPLPTQLHQDATPNAITLAACFLIASKQYEIYAPGIKFLITFFQYAFSKRELERLEIKIIIDLNWKLVDVMSLHFTKLWFEYLLKGELHYDQQSDAFTDRLLYLENLVQYYTLFMLNCKKM